MKILKTIVMFAIIANLATDITAAAAAVVAELLDPKDVSASSVAVKPLNVIRHLGHIPIPAELLGPLKSYVDGLPQIAKCGGKDPQSQIVLFLQAMSPPSKGEEIIGQDALAARLEVMMATEQPIAMVIPGFPCKSTNKGDKVLGGDVDLGEFVGLVTLHYVCEEISTIYLPGARISIIPDGAAYLDVLGIDTREYEQYQRGLAHLIGTCFSETISLEQAMVPNILKIIDTLEEPKVDPETEADMARFFGTEFPKKSKDEIVKITHAVAVCSAKFSKGIAVLLEERDYVRLSVHPHSKMDEKCGIALVSNARGTPWHNAPVLCSGFTLETGAKGTTKINLKKVFPIGDAFGDKGGITLMKLMDLARQQKKSKSGFDITPEFVRADSTIAGIPLSYMVLNFKIVKASSISYKPLWG